MGPCGGAPIGVWGGVTWVLVMGVGREPRYLAVTLGGSLGPLVGGATLGYPGPLVGGDDTWVPGSLSLGGCMLMDTWVPWGGARGVHDPDTGVPDVCPSPCVPHSRKPARPVVLN